MGYDTVRVDDVESRVDDEWGGMWFLADPLGAEHLGVTLLELEPGGRNKPHDHAADGQEEVYLVLDGEIDVDLEDGSVTIGPREAIRLDPGDRRQLVNRGDERARLVLAGAPRST